MREIKFRAWGNKKMYYFNNAYRGQWEFFIGEKGNISNIDYYSGETEHYENEFKKLPILMQYTGLKDKNGKEIYEGDIVKKNNEILQIKWNFLYCEWALFYHSGMQYDIVADICDKNGKTPKQWEATYLEVIGNIYENPNLLNK